MRLLWLVGCMALARGEEGMVAVAPAAAALAEVGEPMPDAGAAILVANSAAQEAGAILTTSGAAGDASGNLLPSQPPPQPQAFFFPQTQPAQPQQQFFFPQQGQQPPPMQQQQQVTPQLRLNPNARQQFYQNCVKSCQGGGQHCQSACQAAAQRMNSMEGETFTNLEQIQSSIRNSMGYAAAQEGTVQYIPNGAGGQYFQQQQTQGGVPTFQGLLPGVGRQPENANAPTGTPHVTANIPKFGVPTLTMEDFNRRFGGPNFAQQYGNQRQQYNFGQAQPSFSRGGRSGGRIPKFGETMSGGVQSGRPTSFSNLQFGSVSSRYTPPTQTFGQATTGRFGGGQFGATQFGAPAPQFGGSQGWASQTSIGSVYGQQQPRFSAPAPFSIGGGRSSGLTFGGNSFGGGSFGGNSFGGSFGRQSGFGGGAGIAGLRGGFFKRK